MVNSEKTATVTGDPTKKEPSSLSRSGPFLLVGVTAVLVAGLVAYGFVTRDEEVILEMATTTSVLEADGVDSSIVHPLSYSQAVAAGTAESIDWGERCDTATGRLAVPDVFAPECMAPFAGDNGGATSPGVTSESIKIVRYQVADNDPTQVYINSVARIDDTNEDQVATLTEFMSYFNTYYEFFGRKVELVTFESRAAANDEAAARADAQKIADQLKPFAVIGGPALTNAFADELAARKILCVDCGAGSTQWFKDRNPFVWSTDASGTQKQIHLVEMVQKQLVGKPAEFGGTAVKALPRVFGHVYLDRGPESNLLAEQLTGRLEAVGAKPLETIPYQLDPNLMTEKATEIIGKLKASGVTTVILSTDAGMPRELTRQAFEQKYEPEWLVADAPLVDSSTYGRAYVPRQWAHAFGVTTRAVRVKDVDGNYLSLHQWYTGNLPLANETVDVMLAPYAFLMSAIQSTGPNLTPDTIAGAIRTLATRQAVTQPFFRWGDYGVWQDGDHSGVEDAALFWWDMEAEGFDERRSPGKGGLMRFADGGKRYLPGEWPTEPRLFVADGSVTFLDAYPAGAERPSYPSPAAGSAESTTTLPGSAESSTTSSSVPATVAGEVPGE